MDETSQPHANTSFKVKRNLYIYYSVIPLIYRRPMLQVVTVPVMLVNWDIT